MPVGGATGASFTTPASLSTTTRYWVQVTSAARTQNSATITITVNPAADTGSSDGPLPPWALGALVAGLVGIASRRLKTAA